MAGDIRRAVKINRDIVENGQAELMFVQSTLDEIGLRVRLAIQRSASVQDVLEPALERMADVSASVSMIRREMSSLWADGQARRWEDNQQQVNSLSSHIHGQGVGGDGMHRKGSGHVG